jgi:hypothetical protein
MSANDKSDTNDTSQVWATVILGAAGAGLAAFCALPAVVAGVLLAPTVAVRRPWFIGGCVCCAAWCLLWWPTYSDRLARGWQAAWNGGSGLATDQPRHSSGRRRAPLDGH